MITAETRMSVHPDVVHTELPSESVLLHLQTGNYYTLNETGQLIWTGLSRGDSVEEVARQLAGRYEVTAEQAREHVTVLAGELMQEMLLQTATA